MCWLFTSVHLQVQCGVLSAGSCGSVWGAVHCHWQAGAVHWIQSDRRLWFRKGDALLCGVQWLRLWISLRSLVLWGVQSFLQEKHSRWPACFTHSLVVLNISRDVTWLQIITDLSIFTSTDCKFYIAHTVQNKSGYHVIYIGGAGAFCCIKHQQNRKVKEIHSKFMGKWTNSLLKFVKIIFKKNTHIHSY